jgi:hypothetical protein
MMKPRDHFAVDRVGLIGLARTFSNIVSPPVMFALVGLFLALHALPLVPALAWAAVHGLLVSLAPILYVLYLLRRGSIVELHMSDVRERHGPYLVATFGALAFLALTLVFQAPQLLRCLGLFNVVTLASLGLINTRWLISFHTTAAAAMLLLAWNVFGATVGLLLVPVLILVIVVRLFLRRHTLAQIFAGLVLGAGTVYFLTLLGCFA